MGSGPAVSCAADELALYRMNFNSCFITFCLHDNICLVYLAFFSSFFFYTNDLLHSFDGSIFFGVQPSSLIFILHEQPHESLAGGGQMCVLAAGMSLFDQGTASECSAASSTLPRGFPDVGSISERFLSRLVLAS